VRIDDPGQDQLLVHMTALLARLSLRGGYGVY
jgi:hypothetical protein